MAEIIHQTKYVLCSGHVALVVLLCTRWCTLYSFVKNCTVAQFTPESRQTKAEAESGPKLYVCLCVTGTSK